MKKRGRPALGFKKMFTDRIFPEPNTGCWIWAGPLDHDGYGVSKITLNGITVTKSHRVSYLLHKGPIDSGLLVCHKCDNRWCVNPDHLFTGTPKDNSQDMVVKGRRPNMPRNQKIKPEKILEIRDRILLGEKQNSLAREFNVTQQAISRIWTKIKICA